MKAYGQFCSIAKALEVIGERWTPLILRELIMGSARFSEIHRGVPRISPSLLTTRLKHLEHSGVIERSRVDGSYTLTPAGWELKPVIETLGIWGNRWVRGQMSSDDYDPDLLMWDMRRRFDLEKLPTGKTCICFEFTDMPEEKSLYWLIASTKGVELCVSDPDHEVDLYVTSDVKTLTDVWNGDTLLLARVEDGLIDLHGPRQLRNAFPSWLQLGLFAAVESAAHTR